MKVLVKQVDINELPFCGGSDRLFIIHTQLWTTFTIRAQELYYCLVITMGVSDAHITAIQF